jgi:hypothetical protein
MFDQHLSSSFSTDNQQFSLYTRRHALGVMGMATAAMLGSSSQASAFLFRKPANPTVNLNELPENWVEMQRSSLNSYIDYLGNLNLEKITVQQVISAHAKQKGSVWNTLPPKSIWKNVSAALKSIDRIGKEMNMPVKEIVSVYRNPAYNARCPGAKSSSWHQSNVAVDVTFPTHASVVTRTARSMRNCGLFRGGVGGYGGFTHIDTRGQNIDW